MRVVLPLMKNVLTQLAMNISLPLVATAAVSATAAAIQNQIYGSGMPTLVISNKQNKDILKIVKLIEESGLLVESVSKTIENVKDLFELAKELFE